MITIDDQYLLRVRKHSELDKVMRALEEHGSLTEHEVIEIGGMARSYYILRIISECIDNIAVDATRAKGRDKDDRHVTMRYTNIIPAVPVPVSQPVVKSDVIDMPVAVQSFGVQDTEIRWPQTPPSIESIGDVFRPQSWFGLMKAMVANGRHIALSGPPGVGKDTAVQELAAREGRILVTIGGDGGFRRRDLVGNLQISNGRSFFEVAEYAAAAIHGWWVLLTEVNAADADALLYINSQLAAPYIVVIGGKAYSVHPDFRLFVSYNPGLVGTKPLPQSFKDRFFSIQVPFWTVEQLTAILVAHGASADAATREIALFGVVLWKAHERGQLRYQVTSRRLMDAVTLLQIGYASSTVEALTMAVIASIDSPVEAVTGKQLLNQFAENSY